MKVAIVTPYNIPNYGAILQAYALQTYLERRGHESFFVNCKYRYPGKFSLLRIICSRNIRGAFAKIQMNRKLDACNDIVRLLHTSRPFFSLRKLIHSPPKADVYLVGSDQVWNFSVGHRCGMYETFLLKFVPEASIRMSYAASFGSCTLPVFVDKKKFAEQLRKFDFISVREDSGIEIVKELIGKPARWVCDPVLLHDAHFWRTMAAPSSAPSQGTLFRYMLGWEDEATLCGFEDLIMRTQKLSAIVDPEHFNGSVASVKGWLSLLLSSNVVITNSFHGTLFAIIFRKNFITLTFQPPYQERNTRVASLLKRLGLAERMFDRLEPERALNVLRSHVDWDSVTRHIGEWKSETDKLFAEVEELNKHRQSSGEVSD